VEWSPGRTPKVQTGTKLGSAGEIERALDESTRAVITPDGWKLCLRDKDKNELYNLQKDPREVDNLFGRTGSQEIIGKLTAEIHRWQKGAGDTIEL
jgi:Domain of unknown function (DUF4976)